MKINEAAQWLLDHGGATTARIVASGEKDGRYAPGTRRMELMPEYTAAAAALTVKEFCQRARIGKTFFYEQANAHKIRIVKAGRKTLIPAGEVEAWRLRAVNENRHAPPRSAGTRTRPFGISLARSEVRTAKPWRAGVDDDEHYVCAIAL